MSALRGSGRSRQMIRFSGPQTTIQHTRVPAGIGAQIQAARYGASGLAAPREGPSIVTGGVARGAYRSGMAYNPATLRAVARSSTARGFAVRRYLQQQREQERQQEQQTQQYVFEAGQERVSTLLELGRTDEAANLVLRLLDMAKTLGYSPQRGGR